MSADDMERVAAAIYEADRLWEHHWPRTWGAVPESWRPRYRRLAVAALVAMQDSA